MNGSGQKVNATIRLIVHSNLYTQRLRLAATMTYKHPTISLCCQCPLLLLWLAWSALLWFNVFNLTLPTVFADSFPSILYLGRIQHSGSFIETEKRIRILSLRLCFRSPRYLQDAARLHADIDFYCIISVHLTDILFPHATALSTVHEPYLSLQIYPCSLYIDFAAHIEM